MKQLRMQGSAASHSIGGWVGTGLMTSTLLVICPAATAATLSAWQFDSATQQLTVTLPSGVTPQVLVAAEPARIVLAIPQTQLGQVDTEQTYDGPVQKVSLSQQEDGSVQVVLELSAETVLDPNHVQLTSMTAGDQTRWVLTPLIAEAETIAIDSPAENSPDNTPAIPPEGIDQVPGATAAAAGAIAEDVVEVPSLPPAEVGADPFLNPPPVAEASPAPAENSTTTTSTPEMVVELPVIPAPQSGLAFPEAGQGRLSTTAANLMLPDDVEGLDNLPETLPIDPFNIGLAETEQVTVPGLEELDAAVGPVATVPQAPATESVTEIPSSAEPDPARSADPGDSQIIAVAPPASNAARNETDIDSAAPPSPAPSIAEVSPEDSSSADNSPGDSQAVAVEPPTATLDESTNADQSETVELAVVPAEPLPAADASADPWTPPPEDAAAVITEPLPPPQVDTSAETSLPIDEAPPEFAPDQGDAIAEGRPSNDILVVPEMPTTNSTETVVPPSDIIPSNEFVVAASEPINFGQPLPEAGSKALDDNLNDETGMPQNEPVPPDILIAAGTVLQLRYPGNEPLVLEAGSNLNEVLVLETEIRDPITQGVLAPRGSQLIGQFQPEGTNQHWVSEMLIVPAGQRVPLASTSEYLVGTPQVDGGRMAAGVGVGALALALLTSFSGIGLLGGAIVGATTMVGTSPQQVVIEPNQIIAVQVTENVPRAMPIAAGPDLSREWGVE